MELKIEFAEGEDLSKVTNLSMADMMLGLIADTNMEIWRRVPSKRQLDYEAIASYISNEVDILSEDKSKLKTVDNIDNDCVDDNLDD